MEAIGRGARPTLSKKVARYYLPLGNGSNLTLVTMNGLTPEGKFVFEFIGEPVPTSLDVDQYQTPVQRGAAEYIKLQNGKEIKYRTLQPDGTLKLTKHGEIFNEIVQVGVLVKIPALHEVQSGANRYKREVLYKVTHPRVKDLGFIGRSKNLTNEQKKEAVKWAVKKDLGLTDETSPLADGSYAYTYDPTRPWVIQFLKTGARESEATVKELMTTPMRGLLETGNIPYVDQVLEVCLRRYEDALCVPRALAELLKMSPDLVIESFDYLLGYKRWRAVGITPDQLEAWCKDQQRSSYMIFQYNGRWDVRHSIAAEAGKRRCVAWCSYNGHCYMYRDAHILARLVSEDGLPHTERHDPLLLASDVEPRIMATSIRTKAPEINQWQTWEGVIKPGYFFSEDLREVRGELCRQGRASRVTYQTVGQDDRPCQYGQLTVTCVEALDGAKGLCHIKTKHDDRHVFHINNWLENIYLATGQRVKWRGQGLPNLTVQVFRQLLRAVRSKLSRVEKDAIREAQQHKCAICKDADIEEFDHVVSLRATKRGERQVFRGLCCA
jgi:uncharacterized membrane protein